MAHKGDGAPGGSYPGFRDGGPSGSDVVYAGADTATIDFIVSEIATPIPSEVEGEFLPRGDGSLAFCNSAGLAATRACLMHIDVAQKKVDAGISPAEVVVGIRTAAVRAIQANETAGKNSACIHHCRLAYTRDCELATGEIRSVDKSAARPMEDEEALDLIGVKTRKSRRKTPLEGRSVFRYFYDCAVGDRNGFSPTAVDMNDIRSILAEGYIFGWLAKRRPESVRKRKKVSQRKSKKEEQLPLF